jgi:hypothetical protein
MKVRVRKDKSIGWIEYNEGEKSFTVDFPSSTVKKSIEDYLNTEQEYRIPESDRLDDFRVDKAHPVDNMTYFELSLNTLFANTDVFVEWETQQGGS